MRRSPDNLDTMLRAYARSGAARLHVPGHKGSLSPWDVTELDDTDDLHHPAGAIASAQRAIAAHCGAGSSFMLVNGATAGNVAMLLSLGLQKHVLVARDAHRSAVTGVAMAGHEVTFVRVDGVVTPSSVQDAFARERRACALLITSPNYYGQCVDIENIARIVHAHNALLLVDEAHGAHFPYAQGLPPSAGAWADLWVHSAHKTLFALTQGALLHRSARGETCASGIQTQQRMLSMVQTSSPTFLLMRSLERSSRMAAEADWEACIAKCEAFRERVAAMPGYRLAAHPNAAAQDPLRLVVNVSGRGWTGYAAAEWLHQRGIVLEMADATRLVGVASPCDAPHWLDAWADALELLPRKAPLPDAPVYSLDTALPRRVMPVREAAFAPSELVPLEHAAGRIAAQAAGAYPPGIAALWPGEVVTEDCIRALARAAEEGASVFGLDALRLACVQ